MYYDADYVRWSSLPPTAGEGIGMRLVMLFHSPPFVMYSIPGHAPRGGLTLNQALRKSW